jgi:NAD(P) transhydrogenase
VERGRRVGGVCVHTGTIPSKTLRETVLNLSGWRERGFYGRARRNKDDITAEDLRRRLHITLDHEVEVLEHQFARNKVTWVSGDARFLGPHAVEVVGDRTCLAFNFLRRTASSSHRRPSMEPCYKE